MNAPDPRSPDFDSDLPPVSVWPKRVGIISIVWACFGLLCNTCGLGQGWILSAAVNLAPPEKRAEIQQQMQDQIQNQSPVQQQGPADHVLIGLRLPLAILLLTAGITLLGRKPISRVLHLAYGVASVLLAIVGTLVFALIKFPAHIDWLKTHGDLPQAKFMSVPIVVATAAFFTLLVLVWPTFCLIWFGLKKRVPEPDRFEALGD